MSEDMSRQQKAETFMFWLDTHKVNHLEELTTSLIDRLCDISPASPSLHLDCDEWLLLKGLLHKFEAYGYYLGNE